MIFRFANYILDVDVERTRAFYERSDIPTMSEQCECVNCQNFEKAITGAPDTVLCFLRSLGVDPQKPIETYNIIGDQEEVGTIWYNGWYHVCGTIVESPGTVVKKEEANGTCSIDYLWENGYAPDPDFPFTVLPILDTSLIHKEFPQPVIQLEIDTHLPYVLQIPFGD